MSFDDVSARRPSDVIIAALGSLCSRHDLVVASRADKGILGSYVVFRGKRSALAVSFENGGYSAQFDQYEGNTVARRVDLGRILRRVGHETALSYCARDMNELDREMRKLADLCERYAGRAIAGEPEFYDELYADS